MIYDFISNYEVNTLSDVYYLTSKCGRYDKVSDVYNRIILFNSSLNKEEIKDYAKFGSNTKRLVFNLEDNESKIKRNIKKIFNEELNISVSENDIVIDRKDNCIKITVGDVLNISIEQRRKCNIHNKNEDLKLKCSIVNNNIYIY